MALEPVFHLHIILKLPVKTGIYEIVDIFPMENDHTSRVEPDVLHRSKTKDLKRFCPKITGTR